MSDLPSPQENAHARTKALRLQAENARLMAEVERLRASSFVTAVPCEQYERVVKAGDAMAHSIDEVISGKFEAHQAAGDAYMLLYIRKWNAAKEGKPSV